jgi:hypothetical protein
VCALLTHRLLLCVVLSFEECQNGTIRLTVSGVAPPNPLPSPSAEGGATAGAAEPEPWACGVCTMLNPRTRYMCSACDQLSGEQLQWCLVTAGIDRTAVCSTAQDRAGQGVDTEQQHSTSHITDLLLCCWVISGVVRRICCAAHATSSRAALRRALRAQALHPPARMRCSKTLRWINPSLMRWRYVRSRGCVIWNAMQSCDCDVLRFSDFGVE